MVAKQFRNILTAKILMGRGFNRTSLAQKMGVHPFVAEKLSKQAGRFSVEELKNAVKESYFMDLANKNSLMDDLISAEILIAKFAEKINFA
jgi:DNA polymerase III delta subunit